MSEQTNNTTSRNKKKRRPKWQRVLLHYWPLIRLILAALLCLALIVAIIVALVKGLSKDDKEPEQDESLAEQTPEPEPEPPTASDAEVSKKMKEADFVAAGYDYEKAAEMLKTLKGWEQIPAVTSRLAEYETEAGKLVVYQNMSSITHVFFQHLIVDTERAFDGDEQQTTYDYYYTTVDEFRAILNSLYEKGFVLVTPYDVCAAVEDAEGNFSFKYGEIRLPAGKTPIMMSQDAVNYYGSMIGDASGVNETPVFANAAGDGFASRIVIGDDGYPTCEYVDAQGKTLTGEYDLVPILEAFIQDHPDFSYKGARAVLSVSGYEGVFGYRTKPSYETALGAAAYKTEVDNAKKVAQCLRDHGWILASNSYGMPDYGNAGSVKVQEDSDKWENTVETIIGETDILMLPYGSDFENLDNYTFNNYTFAVLFEDGYRYFFNRDSIVSWHQVGDVYFRGNRRSLDGYSFYNIPSQLSDLIDVEEILDPNRPGQSES